MKKTGFGSGSESDEPDLPEPAVPADETNEVDVAGTPGAPVDGDGEQEGGAPSLTFPPLPPKASPAPSGNEANPAYGSGSSLDPLSTEVSESSESSELSEPLEAIVLPEPTVAWPERSTFSAEKYLESLFGRNGAGAGASMDAGASASAEEDTSADQDTSAGADEDSDASVDVAADVAAAAEVAADAATSVDASAEAEAPLEALPLPAELPEVEMTHDPETASVPLGPVMEPEVPQEDAPSLPEIPAMPAWTAPAEKAQRKKPLAFIGAVVAVILAFGGGYAVRAFTAPSAGEVHGKQNPVADAPKVVEAYLEALASGDAETARRITGASSSETLLSDKVLKRSLELAPISSVSVGKGKADGDEAEVSAKFRVGETNVDRSFRLRNTSGGWQLFDGLVSVSLPALNSLGVQLNGAKPNTVETRVFPGTYQLALSNSAFALNSKSDVWTIATAEQASELRDVQPKLTEEASARYVELVKGSLNACLALTELVTPCGLDVSARLKDGSTPIEGTVQRSLDNEGQAALDSLVIQTDPAAAATVFSTLNIQVKTRLEAENNGSRVSGELLYGGQLLSPHVDFTAENPTVVWQ